MIGLLVWSVASAGWLRFDPPQGGTGVVHGISDGRTYWTRVLENPHPITLAQWANGAAPGPTYARIAASARGSGKQLMIETKLEKAYGFVFETKPYTGPAVSALPVGLVVDLVEIGAKGLTAGPDVYVFDTQSLANPIGSHMAENAETFGRLGGKGADPVWMIARFTNQDQPIPAWVASESDVVAARRALGCGQLKSYLHDITAPLSVSQMFSDLTSSLSNTTFRFSPDPMRAERQLCGPTEEQARQH